MAKRSKRPPIKDRKPPFKLPARAQMRPRPRVPRLPGWSGPGSRVRVPGPPMDFEEHAIGGSFDGWEPLERYPGPGHPGLREMQPDGGNMDIDAGMNPGPPQILQRPPRQPQRGFVSPYFNWRKHLGPPPPEFQGGGFGDIAGDGGSELSPELVELLRALVASRGGSVFRPE